MLLVVGGAAWVGSVRLGGFTGIWLMPLSITAPVASILAYPVTPLRRLQAALERLVARRVGVFVTLTTFASSAGLVAFAMVATVASPELASTLGEAPGGFAQLIGTPIAWGMWMVPAALQTIAFVLIIDCIPAEYVRLRQALASNTAAGLVLLLVLFGVLAYQLALLALIPFIGS